MNLTANRYWLKNAHVPLSLVSLDNKNLEIKPTREGLCLIDIEITKNIITNIIPVLSTPQSTATGSDNENAKPEQHPALSTDLRGGQVWPCFVDMHTHLDKGHIWEHSPNPDGTFASAIETAKKYSQTCWQAEDVYRRMEFGIKCSYAHGTQAIRTHIDSFGEQGIISLEVFKTLQKSWKERVILQAVSLVTLDYYQTHAGVDLANRIAAIGGILGGVAYMNPDLDAQLDTIFYLAKEREIDLDFHTDENLDSNSICLQKIAQAAIRNNFTGQIICGHCCSLAVQTPEVVETTLNLVKQAKIGIVSLPMCNLYLQDRQANRTPQWRGVTILQEIKQHGIPVAVASDNCRDPFYSFGDHDVLEVFTQAVRIAHLDMPYGDWPCAVTKTSADLIKLPPNIGKIAVGLPADLIVFKGRNFSELLSRSQHDRIVIREGKQIDTTLPDYAELDDWN